MAEPQANGQTAEEKQAALDYIAKMQELSQATPVAPPVVPAPNAEELAKAPE